MNEQDMAKFAAILKQQREEDQDKSDRELLIELKVTMGFLGEKVGKQNGRVGKLEWAVGSIFIILAAFGGPKIIGWLIKLGG